MCSKSNYTKPENKSPLDNHVCVRKFLNYRQLKAERLCHGKGHSVLFSSQSFPKQLLLGTVRDRSRRTFGLVQYSCSLVPLFLFYSSNKVYFYSSPQNCGQHTGKDFTRNPDFCDFPWYSQEYFFLSSSAQGSCVRGILCLLQLRMLKCLAIKGQYTHGPQ